MASAIHGVSLAAAYSPYASRWRRKALARVVLRDFSLRDLSHHCLPFLSVWVVHSGRRQSCELFCAHRLGAGLVVQMIDLAVDQAVRRAENAQTEVPALTLGAAE